MRTLPVGIWSSILIGTAGLALVGVLPGTSHETWLMIGDGVTNGRLGFWTTIVGGRARR